MIIKKKKRLNFNEFVDGLDPNLNFNNFWKVIKLFKNSEVFSSKTTPVSSKSDLVERFIDGFAPAGNMVPFPEVITSRYPSFFDMQFQLHELEEIILSARQGSPLGSDLINHSVLKLSLAHYRFKDYLIFSTKS